jgi:hypothetical protein
MPRGQTAHLEGKRTGRPKGTGHRSRLLADMRWAYETIGNSDARPPSEGAKFCKELALRDLAKFVETLGKLEVDNAQRPSEGPEERAQTLKSSRSEPGRTSEDAGGPATNGVRKKRPKRVMKLFIESRRLLARLTGDGTAWVSNLPRDARIVRSKKDRLRDGIVFLIYSDCFEPIPEGQAVPEMEPEYARG